MAIDSTDLALVTARVHCCRLGASRLGFTPYDVKGPSSPYPCEYIWREVQPPTTAWTLITQGSVCGKQPTANFDYSGEVTPEPVAATSTVEGTVTLDLVAQVGMDVSMTVDGVAWPGGVATTNGAGFYQFLLVPAGVIVVSCVLGPNNGVTVPPATLVLDIVAQS